MTWGFPRYDGKGLVINARSESVLDRPMFRDSARRRRCIIPAHAFYEWDASKKLTTFTRPGHPVIYMAGVYDFLQGANRFTVLTTEANESVRRYHDRMPLLLEREALEPWLNDDQAMEELLHRKMPALDSWQENEQMSLF